MAEWPPQLSGARRPLSFLVRILTAPFDEPDFRKGVPQRGAAGSPV